MTDGTLTIGTDSPAYEPWFANNDPSNGKGYESAVAYAVAEAARLRPVAGEVGQGAVQQLLRARRARTSTSTSTRSRSRPTRAKVVDFSDGYYTAAQARDRAEGHARSRRRPASPTSRAYKLGAQTGTTSLTAIRDVIQPTPSRWSSRDTNAAKQALLNGQVDAIVADLPTAFYITAVADPARARSSASSSRRPARRSSSGCSSRRATRWSAASTRRWPRCTTDGTLDAIEKKWLSQTVERPRPAVTADGQRREPSGPAERSGAGAASRRRRCAGARLLVATAGHGRRSSRCWSSARSPHPGWPRSRRRSSTGTTRKAAFPVDLARASGLQRQAVPDRRAADPGPGPGGRARSASRGRRPAAAADRRGHLHRPVPRHPDDPAGVHAGVRGPGPAASRASPTRCSSGALVALVLSYGAYVAEVFRAGIESIHPSQIASADALGLSRGPGDALRRRAAGGPPRRSRRCSTTSSACRRTPPWSAPPGCSMRSSRRRTTPTSTSTSRRYVVVAALFIVLTIPLARFTDWLQRRAMERERAGRPMTDALLRGHRRPQVVRRQGGAAPTSTSPCSPHDVVCLIGSSGSGKSTLLRCLNLLEDIDDGVIRFEGARDLRPAGRPAPRCAAGWAWSSSPTTCSPT